MLFKDRIMGLKKKKNIIILTACMVICFILYQLYFFLAITSEAGLNERVIRVMDHHEIEELKEQTQKRVVISKTDKFINNNGVIRGVLQINMSKYRADSNNEFKCLTMEKKIPFDQVNDDYCDCEDGTDEPSTNACINGTFYCDTQLGSKSVSFFSVPSGQVNDGVCDCCDGSDEWLHDHRKSLLSQLGAKFVRFLVRECPNKC